MKERRRANYSRITHMNVGDRINLESIEKSAINGLSANPMGDMITCERRLIMDLCGYARRLELRLLEMGWK